MGWVLDQSKVETSAARMVMVAIANHIDPRGDGWAYVSEILRTAGVSEKTYHRAVQKAVDLGELEVDERGGGSLKMKGGYRPNRYVFPKFAAERGTRFVGETDAGCGGHPDHHRPPQPGDHRGGHPDQDTGGSIRKEPSKNLQRPRKNAATPSPQSQARADAEIMVKAWWDASDPKPVEKWIGVVKIIERCLEAGWHYRAVQHALHRAPCVTVNAMMFGLRTSGRDKGSELAESAFAWLDQRREQEETG